MRPVIFKDRGRKASQEIKGTNCILKVERTTTMKAQSSKAMGIDFIRQLGSQIEMQMAISKLRKGKGKGKVHPTAPITITTP